MGLGAAGLVVHWGNKDDEGTMGPSEWQGTPLLGLSVCGGRGGSSVSSSP